MSNLSDLLNKTKNNTEDFRKIKSVEEQFFSVLIFSCLIF